MKSSWRDRRGLVAAVVVLVTAAAAALVGIGFEYLGQNAQAMPRSVVRSGPVADRSRELIAVWKGVVARDPNSFTGWRKLAEARISLARAIGDDGLYHLAESDLRRSLALWPADLNIEAQGLLAVVLGAQHRFRESLDLATRALAQNPNASWLLAVQGDAALALGDYESATRILARFVKHEPGFAAWTRLAQLEKLDGQESSARRLLERARDGYTGSDPEPAAWVRVQIGILDLERGRLDAAREHFEDALGITPDYYLAAEHLAETYEIEGRHELARPWLERAIQVKRAPDLLLRLAAIEERSGHRELGQSLLWEARSALESTCAANPDAHLRAMAEFLLDHPAGPADLTHALELARRDATIRGGIDVDHLLARALRLNGQLDEAQRHADASLSRGFAPADYWLEAAHIQSALGQSSEAERLTAHAKSINPYAGR
ncbi:MAG: tetratricopeptide repeat protein [Planctomycetes bacterium]|nr:tetratricopeptide repeat protein [Planctomycetota bacterium]